MKISIIIPTHNRADSLKEAIESIIALTAEAAFEVVVVDNNSTDHTKQVAESYGNTVKYVFEGRTAFSRARRTGADNASGDILLYIDDDVLLRPGSLRNIVQVFAQVPDCGVIAGRIDPKFTKTPPPWTLACNQSFNGWSLYNPETYSFLGTDFTEVPSAAGPMMAIRQSVFKQIGGFPPDTIGVETNVGQRTFKKLYIGPGDYGLCLKTQAAGFKVYYSPDIACYHVIPDIRFSIGFWRSRMVGEGHYTAIANRGFFNLSESRIFIENKRAQIKYFQVKHHMLEKVRILEKSHPPNPESMGMLPEELWIYYYAAYLEMDWVLRKYPDLWPFLWKIGAEGVDDNDFENVMNRLPAEYKEIIGADVIKDLSPVNSISTYEYLMANLRHEVKRECEVTDSIITDVYQLLHHDPHQLNALDMFLADGQIETAIRVLDSVQEMNSSNPELGRWIAALKKETSTRVQASEPGKPAGTDLPLKVDTAKSKQPSGDGDKKEVQTAEELIFQRAVDFKDKGKLDMDAENFSSALQSFDEAMYLCPQLPDLQRFRAVCLAALKCKFEAIVAACAALSQQPDDAMMLTLIAKNLQPSRAEIKNSPTQTLHLLDRTVRCTGVRISGIQYLRALCLIALSRLAEASAALEQELSLQPQDGASKALLHKIRDARQYETQQRSISAPKPVSTTSQVLPIESIQWIIDSRLDPTGRVFSHEGEIYRAIYPTATQKVKHLFDSNLVQTLVEKRFLVESQITDLKVPGFGLVIHHKRIPYISRAEEWPRKIFLDAAKTVIKINLELLKFGYVTIDYHSHNIQQFHNAIPLWMDFGSIVARDQLATKNMQIEFNEWFAHYLILLSKFSNLDRVCRSLMNSGGISIEEFQSLTGMKIDVPAGTDMPSWLHAALEWLESIRFPQKQTQWGNYYSEGEQFRLPDPNADSFKKPNTRTGIVYELISKYRPRKIIDIGCNAGLFSVLATHSGAEVCAIDYDEASLELFYEALSKETPSLPITIIQRDIGNAEQQRRRPVKGDFAMALAVTHHMFLTQKYSFNNIAYILSSYSTDILLTEFMPDGLGIGAPVPNPLPEEYAIEKMKASFRPYFRHIEEITYPSGKSRRIFILCRDRTSLNEIIVTPS